VGECVKRIGTIIIKSLFLIPDRDAPIINAAWTLRHEIFFFLLLGSLFIGRWLCSIVFIGLAVATVLNATVMHYGYPTAFFLSPYNLEFCAGMVTAHYFTRRLPLPFPSAVAILGAVVFLATASSLTFTTLVGANAGIGLKAVSGALIVLGLAERERRYGTLPGLGWLRYLGVCSYSIYIVQPTAISALLKLYNFVGLRNALPLYAAFAALALTTLAVGIATYWLIERPLHRLCRERQPVTRVPTLAAEGACP